MWCCRRMEKISWTDHVRNEEVLLRVNEQRNILHEIRKRKANWISPILRRNCLLQQVIEGKIKDQIEVTRRRGRRRKKLLDDLKDRRGYCRLKEQALDRTVWRNRFGRGFGPVVWQITDDDDDDDDNNKHIVVSDRVDIQFLCIASPAIFVKTYNPQKVLVYSGSVNVFLSPVKLCIGGLRRTVVLWSIYIFFSRLTLIVLMWRIGWAHNNARK